MKDVFVVYGRKECIGVDFAFDDRNHLTEAEIFGVFISFETALEEFKKIVVEARGYFIENAPFSIDEDLLDNAKTADLFDDYNMDADFDWDDGDDEDDEGEDRVDIQWQCYIGNNHAKWEMFPTTMDPFETSILASVYIQKKTVKG